jgi:LysM repeat protein
MSRFSRLCLATTLLAGLLVLVNSQSVFRADGAQPSSNQYLVQPGDDLWKIAIQLEVEPEDLAEANGVNLEESLQVGQNLLIPESSAKTYLVKQGESLWSIASKQGITTNQLLKVNKNLNPDMLKIGQVLYLPVRNNTEHPHARVSFVKFDWPVIGTITSKFGWRKGEFHGGVDIAVDTGNEVRAAKAGTVTLSGWNAGFGQTIKIDHGDGYCSIYAHNSKLLVKNGQQVNAGEVVALSGNSGRSTGPHIHFEIRYNGVAQNPTNLLNSSMQVADIQ